MNVAMLFKELIEFLIGSEGNVRLEMAMSVTIEGGNVFEGCLYFNETKEASRVRNSWRKSERFKR